MEELDLEMQLGYRLSSLEVFKLFIAGKWN